MGEASIGAHEDDRPLLAFLLPQKLADRAIAIVLRVGLLGRSADVDEEAGEFPEGCRCIQEIIDGEFIVFVGPSGAAPQFCQIVLQYPLK